MSGRLVRAALEDDLDDAGPRERAGLRAVLVVLADASPEGGRAWLARATIAARAHKSERQVVRLLGRLEDLGRITCAAHRQGGRGRAPEWIITPGAPAERVTPRPVKGDTENRERVTPRTVKGDAQVSPQRSTTERTTPLPPRSGGYLPSGEDHPALAERPALPGLELGAEGLPALGTPRAVGSNPRALGTSPRQRARAERLAAEAARQDARRVQVAEADAARASSAEALGALEGTEVGELLRRRATG